MSAMKIDCRVKLDNEGGWVSIVVDLPLHAASDVDRAFVTEVLRILTAWTGRVRPPVMPSSVVVDKRAERAKPEVPEVLRGLVRSAQ